MNEFSSSLTSLSIKPDFYLKMNIKLLQSNLDIVLYYYVWPITKKETSGQC